MSGGRLATAADARIEALLARERVIIALALLALTVVAWIYLATMEMPGEMGAMSSEGSMSGEAMGHAGMAMSAWSASRFSATFAMWVIMMVGMMTPSAARTILLFAALHRKAGDASRRYPSTALFAAGYLLAWTGYALVATVAQWQLSSAGLLSADMKAAPVVSALLLLGAGTYQFLPLKETCLTHCRSPADFLVAHRRSGAFGPLLMGLHHGAYCVGCCWLLMGLLFALGVMSLSWVAALTALVIAEKLMPGGRYIAWAGGATMIAAGLIALLSL